MDGWGMDGEWMDGWISEWKEGKEGGRKMD